MTALDWTIVAAFLAVAFALIAGFVSVLTNEETDL